MTLIILLLCSINLLLIIYCARRVWWIQRSVNTARADIRASATHVDDIYTQLESLQHLGDSLDLRGQLPPLRGYASSPDFLRTVATHVLTHRPRLVIECSSGASTVVIARALQINGAGHVFSLEHLDEYRHETTRLLDRAGLGDWATVVLAPLRTHNTSMGDFGWYDLETFKPDGQVDLLVIDGPPAAADPLVRYPAGPELFPYLSNDSYVLLDDANRPGEKRIIERWLDEGLAASATYVRAEKGCAQVRPARR